MSVWPPGKLYRNTLIKIENSGKVKQHVQMKNTVNEKPVSQWQQQERQQQDSTCNVLCIICHWSKLYRRKFLQEFFFFMDGGENRKKSQKLEPATEISTAR